ncbi:hypothetical protein NIES2135_54430 [Leptolyngbya boryana NIES-2135]|jgi:hypothetical protein|uniref:DUF1653 domain-containing protein n=1 Tax=Leptolyngbya boryana NIES-2135 TaxID=1973484 RepID=A0A1Z4JPE5_LEPBY|nr:MULTISPECIES: hypothetical protein [Leptolyngbya]BAY58570.1 hypothetical protein NIES2135_54430 [Leptolyngbya boryana NIES-2135]MBD2370754.1 hypothetical protein [Leptolyngbya sp. FACHB-161]MBD2377093.1 hypothetical protein [Leptolyngbya sp. FACHB-238]MBD2401536.1 hypothetical protein [Leptolyngbya sp. FACHB-239]MBD2408088.1 hypothetical protein [Leptolyngbya sp. FACHB-402]
MTHEIKSGQIYRHHKGKIAMVLAIAKFVPERRFVFGNPQPYTYCRAKSTEEDYAIDIFYEADGTLAQTHIMSSLVIYACSGEIWFRTVDEFGEVLGDTHDPVGGTMFYRFQLIQESEVRST